MCRPKCKNVKELCRPGARRVDFYRMIACLRRRSHSECLPTHSDALGNVSCHATARWIKTRAASSVLLAAVAATALLYFSGALYTGNEET